MKKSNLTELSDLELIEIGGGNPGLINKIYQWGKAIYTALEIQEVINEFVDGWNSVDCQCDKK